MWCLTTQIRHRGSDMYRIFVLDALVWFEKTCPKDPLSIKLQTTHYPTNDPVPIKRPPYPSNDPLPTKRPSIPKLCQHKLMLLPTVATPIFNAGRDGFAGYYSFFLPERCWDSKGERLISEESWGSSKLVTCLDVINKKVTKVTSTGGTWLVLDVSHDLIVAQFSTPTTPPQLVSPQLRI